MFLTKQDMQLGNERSQHGGRGLGRLGNGTYTYYDCKAAEERAEAAREDPDAACDDEDDAADDVFQGHHQQVAMCVKLRKVIWPCVKCVKLRKVA